MKKNRMAVVSVLFALCALLVSACSKSDEEEAGKKPAAPATVGVSYQFGISQDYLNLADLTVVYWNDKGEQEEMILTSTTWKKSFTITQSQKIGYIVMAIPKQNLDELLIADSYKLGYEYVDSYFGSNGKGKKSSTSYLMTIPRVKTSEYIEKHKTIHQFSVTWDKDSDTFTTE